VNDRLAVLHAIAFGDDAELRPADRLRALEMIREEEAAAAVDEECPDCRLRAEQEARMSPDEAARIMAALFEISPFALVEVLLGRLEASDEVVDALSATARREAAALTEVRRVEEEVERRAEQRAAELLRRKEQPPPGGGSRRSGSSVENWAPA
jgi:hypothetical protein